MSAERLVPCQEAFKLQCLETAIFLVVVVVVVVTVTTSPQPNAVYTGLSKGVVKNYVL